MCFLHSAYIMIESRSAMQFPSSELQECSLKQKNWFKGITKNDETQ